MASSAGYYKASPVPFIFLSTHLQQLCLLAFMMMPFITSTSNNTESRGCIKAERDALLAFRAEIIHNNSHPISSWGNQTDDCCHWAGVSCDNINSGGHVVVGVNLEGGGDWGCLSGNMSQSLIDLQHLRYLDLSNNCFFKISIPKLLGSLENLVHLDLSYSGFTGLIPHELGNLSRLRYLNLVNNEILLEVDDAEWLSGLSSLRHLLLGGANFSGVNNVMQSLNKLQVLEEVSLPRCSMNSIPESLPDLNFNSLTVMDINNNNYFISIPEWLFRIPNLRHLSMIDCGFIGTIPSSIGNPTTSLQSLYLSDNRGIHGDMPRGFGNLCNLQSLYLDNTFVGKSLEGFRDAFSGCIRLNLNELSFENSSLQGPLPDWLGEFTNLTYLHLSSNSFHSSIPESLGSISGLQYLGLANNALNGSIPASLGRLAGLLQLDLASNALNGPIPESIFQLSNLLHLDLSGNKFNYSSVITEAHLANLTSLNYLSLDQLVLNISADWIPSFQAYAMYLSFCQVGPKFPHWLSNQVNLFLLNISNAGIKDSIPDWFWNITYTITALDLSNNEINGRLPERLKFQAEGYGLQVLLGSNRLEGSIPYFPPNIGALDLSNNLFSGIIPTDLGNFGGSGMRPQLTFLSLSSNKLNGGIPNSFCNFVDLVLLELSNNHLEGAIPNCWNNLTGLQYLVLANNSLAGELPDSLISSSQSLQVLHLSNNKLHGGFPSFLKKCTSITTLALDHNNLSGKIPSWVGETMTSLMILTLKENNFSGDLPLLSNLTSLHFLDLSHNSFVGSIPQSYGNLTGMIDTSMNGGAGFSTNISEVLIIRITVTTKGMVLKFGVILSSFKFMDLSANNLLGQIPKEIVNLVGLQSLDLSRNNLSGKIPTDIGRMQSLESLDLSRNELIGSIPPGLSTLHFLESLNLSHNNLSGKIPYASQMTTFNDPSSYAGNLNLCGAPLDKNCTSDEPTSNGQVDDQEFDDDDDDDDDDSPVWFGIGLMLGFVVGFWVVWGILLFKKEWRHIYFRFLDHTYDMMYVKIVVTISKIKRALVPMRSK